MPVIWLPFYFQQLFYEYSVMLVIRIVFEFVWQLQIKYMYYCLYIVIYFFNKVINIAKQGICNAYTKHSQEIQFTFSLQELDSFIQIDHLYSASSWKLLGGASCLFECWMHCLQCSIVIQYCDVLLWFYSNRRLCNKFLLLINCPWYMVNSLIRYFGTIRESGYDVKYQLWLKFRWWTLFESCDFCSYLSIIPVWINWY